MLEKGKNMRTVFILLAIVCLIGFLVMSTPLALRQAGEQLQLLLNGGVLWLLGAITFGGLALYCLEKEI